MLDDSYDSDIAKILIDYAIECKPPNSRINYLLKRFKKMDTKLPVSHKTLFKKLSIFNYTVGKFNPGQNDTNSKFVYFGLKDSLIKSVQLDMHEENIIK